MIYDPVIIALNKLRPGAQWTLTDSHLGVKWIEDSVGNLIPANIIWNDPSPIPSKEELDLEIQAAELDYKNTEYQRLRRPEYPPLEQLADALYWQAQGDSSKMTSYLAAVEAVKQKYPKE